MSFACLVAQGLAAQGGPASWIASEPVPLYKTGLGTFTRPISSRVPGTQAYFDQGLQMMFSFAKREAVLSFRESWKRDPDCAICYWGEAWAWGSYLNAPMSPAESPYAYAAVQKAMSFVSVRRRSSAT